MDAFEEVFKTLFEFAEIEKKDAFTQFFLFFSFPNGLSFTLFCISLHFSGIQAGIEQSLFNSECFVSGEGVKCKDLKGKRRITQNAPNEENKHNNMSPNI